MRLDLGLRVVAEAVDIVVAGDTVVEEGMVIDVAAADMVTSAVVEIAADGAADARRLILKDLVVRTVIYLIYRS
jgi:hypothetical protein